VSNRDANSTQYNNTQEQYQKIKRKLKQTELSDNFQVFWTAYPRHEEKSCLKAIRKLKPDQDLLDKTLFAIANQKKSQT